MRTAFSLRWVRFACCLIPLAGCTTEAWYEGAKRSAEYQCRQQPVGAVDDCLSRLNKARYDTYEKDRATQK